MFVNFHISVTVIVLLLAISLGHQSLLSQELLVYLLYKHDCCSVHFFLRFPALWATYSDLEEIRGYSVWKIIFNPPKCL